MAFGDSIRKTRKKKLRSIQAVETFIFSAIERQLHTFKSIAENETVIGMSYADGTYTIQLKEAKN